MLGTTQYSITYFSWLRIIKSSTTRVGLPQPIKWAWFLNLWSQCIESSNYNTVVQHMYLSTHHYRPHCCVYKIDVQRFVFSFFLLLQLKFIDQVKNNSFKGIYLLFIQYNLYRSIFLLNKMSFLETGTRFFPHFCQCFWIWNWDMHRQQLVDTILTNICITD